MKKIVFVAAVWCAASFGGAGMCASEDGVPELKMYAGEVKILPVSNPTRIVIGNPDVVDVGSVAKNEVTINPKAPGVTSLVLWDNFGEQSYQVRVFPVNLTDVKRRIDNLLGKLEIANVHAQVEEEEGKILLMGEVKTAGERERIAAALGGLKDRCVDLVMVREDESDIEIEAQLLELDTDATKSLGFTAPAGITVSEDATKSPLSGSSIMTLFKVPAFLRTASTSSAGSGSGSSTTTSAAFAFQLDALIQENKARLLSRPRVVCQSGKEAELMVGGEKPIFTTAVQSAGASSTSVEYKEYGIKLKIKPTITKDNRIKLSLNAEISEISNAQGETIGDPNAPTAKAYPLNKRNIQTEVFVDDGETLAIGGLMKQKLEEGIRKTAGLGDLPIVGLFFRSKTTKIGGGAGTKDNAELFITITPKIVNQPQEKPKTPKTPSQPSVSTAGVIDESLPEPLRTYSGIVQKRILDNLSYPQSAREAAFQGTAKLGLKLSYKGELLDIAVRTSSGYKILDDNAVYVARSVAPYPPFPSGLSQKEIWVEIPIVYRLE